MHAQNVPALRAVDAIAAAAFALRGRPGAYAVLLGSGVSTGAGAPTGWQILKLLISELASTQQKDPGADPIAWYAEEFGNQPTYSGVVAALGLTAPERQALISRLLDGEDGPRAPSPAHYAVARLVAGGWVRVILTTNFDRLTENALVEAGVNPTVLATPESVRGSLPLVHVGPVIVKLHGDQHDPRILNTDVELDGYQTAVDELLDRVFDEYGLIVCGWSADHDKALRSALERASSHRFTTFWSVRGAIADITDRAAALVSLRRAEVIEHTDADTFFGRLADACEALEASNRSHPLSVAAGVAVAKRELAGAHVAISLHDVIRSEIERVRDLDFLSPDPRSPGHDQDAVVNQAAGESELLVALIATAAYWGRPETDRWWMGDIVRMARRPLLGGVQSVLDRPRIPALFTSWAAGTAAVASDRYDLLTKLFALEGTPNVTGSTLVPAVLSVPPGLLQVPDGIARLYRVLRDVFVYQLALGREGFVEAWERWQYLLAVASLDAGGAMPTEGIRVEEREPVLPVPHSWACLEVDRLGPEHPLLRAGYFDGEPEKLIEALEAARTRLANSASNADFHLLGPRGGSLPSGRHYPGSFSDDPDSVFGESSQPRPS